MAFGLLIATLASITVLVVALMGLFGRLPRNHIAGLRTPAIMKSDATWDAAHRAGAAPMIFTAVAATAIGLAFLPFVLADAVSDGLAAGMVMLQAALLLGGVLVSWLLGTRAAKAVEP